MSRGEEKTKPYESRKPRLNRWLPLLCVVILSLSLAHNWQLRHQFRSEIERLTNEQDRLIKSLNSRLQQQERDWSESDHRHVKQLIVAKLDGRPIQVTGMTAEGQEFDWNRYRGRPVLLHCWSAGCLICQDEFQAIQHLQQACQSIDLQVVGLSQDILKHRDKAVAKLKEHNVQWTNLLATPTSRPQINGLWIEWPATYVVVNSEGIAVSVTSPLLSPKKEDNLPSLILPNAQTILKILEAP
jgi:hypothetical protein